MGEKNEVWGQLAAALPEGTIAWRQEGKSVPRDGRYFARFVAYIEANTVRERLDSVVPGGWDLTLELLPALALADDESGGQACSFKARLQVLGVVREDVGNGRDYKSAATDAFKRAAVRFGIAHELYAYEQNWVQVDGEGRHPKPLEDPQSAYERRYGLGGPPLPADAAPASDEPACPKCGGRMWDNRSTKRNPRAPDFKCRDRGCDGVVWPAVSAGASATVATSAMAVPIPADEIPF